jgi:hypothetical protein
MWVEAGMALALPKRVAAHGAMETFGKGRPGRSES